MNMMNKCAKFHKDSLSGKKVKLNLPSAIELSGRPFLCTTLYRNPMQVSNFGGIFDQLSQWRTTPPPLFRGSTRTRAGSGVLPRKKFSFKVAEI